MDFNKSKGLNVISEIGEYDSQSLEVIAFILVKLIYFVVS